MKMLPRLVAIALLPALLVLVSCGSKKQGPSGIDEFVKTYQTAFEAQDREAIMLMIDFGQTPVELRDFTKEFVFPYLGLVEVVSIRAEPYVPEDRDRQQVDGKDIEPAPTPTHRMILEFEPETPRDPPEEMDVLVVEEDGDVKLCGWRFVE